MEAKTKAAIFAFAADERKRDEQLQKLASLLASLKVSGEIPACINEWQPLISVCETLSSICMMVLPVLHIVRLFCSMPPAAVKTFRRHCLLLLCELDADEDETQLLISIEKFIENVIPQIRGVYPDGAAKLAHWLGKAENKTLFTTTLCQLQTYMMMFSGTTRTPTTVAMISIPNPVQD